MEVERILCARLELLNEKVSEFKRAKKHAAVGPGRSGLVRWRRLGPIRDSNRSMRHHALRAGMLNPVVEPGFSTGALHFPGRRNQSEFVSSVYRRDESSTYGG